MWALSAVTWFSSDSGPSVSTRGPARTYRRSISTMTGARPKEAHGTCSRGVGSGVHESSGVFCRWEVTHLPLAAEPDGLPCQCGNVSSYRVRTDQHGNYCTGRGIKHYSPGAPVQMPALGCRARWAVVTVWTCEITQVQTAWQSLQRQWRWEPQPSSTFAIACKQRQASPPQQDANSRGAQLA